MKTCSLMACNKTPAWIWCGVSSSVTFQYISYRLCQFPDGGGAVCGDGVPGWWLPDRCGYRNLYGWSPDSCCLPRGELHTRITGHVKEMVTCSPANKILNIFPLVFISTPAVFTSIGFPTCEPSHPQGHQKWQCAAWDGRLRQAE